MTPLYITAADAAQRLGLPGARALLRRRADLEKLGFPAPAPWSQRPLRWRASAVDAWAAAIDRLTADGQPVLPAEPAANDVAFARALARSAA